MSMSELLVEFVESTIKRMVDKEKEIKIGINLSTKNIIIQIEANKNDLGKIIGKKGRSIEALKIITSAVKNTKFPDDTRNICLEILEEQSKFSREKV